MIKQCISALGLLLIAAAPAAAEERRFTVGSFDRIRVEGPVEVIVVSGAQPMVLAEGDGRALAALDVGVRGSILFVRSQKRRVLEEARRSSGEPLMLPKVFVDARSISAITLVGPGRLSLDRLTGKKASVVLDGPGMMSVDFADPDALSLSFSGNGSLTIAGNVQDIDAVLTGFGTVDAAELSSLHLDLTSEGYVNSRFAASESARIGANGETRVEVFGSPKCSVRESGKAVILCGAGSPR